MALPSLTPRALSEEIQSGIPLFLLDVREPFELEICRLDQVHPIPMAQVPVRITEIPQDVPVVVLCRSGKRSADVTEYLLGSGFKNVRNLTGGMLAWSDEVDPTIPKY